MELEKLSMKFMWESKETVLAKTYLKKNKVGGTCLSNYQDSLYSSNNEESWIWDRLKNRLESSEMYRLKYET